MNELDPDPYTLPPTFSTLHPNPYTPVSMYTSTVGFEVRNIELIRKERWGAGVETHFQEIS